MARVVAVGSSRVGKEKAVLGVVGRGEAGKANVLPLSVKGVVLECPRWRWWRRVLPG